MLVIPVVAMPVIPIITMMMLIMVVMLIIMMSIMVARTMFAEATGHERKLLLVEFSYSLQFSERSSITLDEGHIQEFLHNFLYLSIL